MGGRRPYRNDPELSEDRILDLRPAKNESDFYRPHLFLNEQEPDGNGNLKEVNTIFLTNKECAFKCLMCDLWKNTRDEPTPGGAIPEQIRFALERLPDASDIKLYNSGNFFDRKAIPPADYPEICSLLPDYQKVIVENHPRLCNQSVVKFRDRLGIPLEVAIGLETIHPGVLPKLNKKITAENFRQAAGFLGDHQISTRAFILLNPPFITDVKENIDWCLKSVEFAFDCGVNICSIIPTRPGNGIMDALLEDGRFVPPDLSTFEKVTESALQLERGLVFADIWDLNFFSDCADCFQDRRGRLNQMNLQQRVLPAVDCHCRKDTD